MQRVPIGSVLLVMVVCAHAQTLTPREIFYGEGRAKAVQKPAAAKPQAVARKSTTVAPPESAAPAPAPVPAAPEQSQDEVATLVSSKVGPLGLKYSVLKRASNGEYREVDPESNFTAGDHIKVNVEVNDPGYLYVVAQGTSGIWKVLYPSRDVNNGDNKVHAGHQYSIPNDAVFTFDSRAGTEKLFVILSRQPEKDLESLIYSLRDKNPNDRTLVAANTPPIQDDVVQHLRQTYSRDLVIEKVDDAATPPSDAVKKIEAKNGALIPAGEKAVYVVNRNAGENARVVADVELRHQ